MNGLLRNIVPLLSILALFALFLLLPELPDFWSLFKCKNCSIKDPYFILWGAAYFSTLLAVSFLFPNFPSQSFAWSGFIWAASLAVTLTYLYWPDICSICLFCHGCHIAIWSIWILFPTGWSQPPKALKERLCIIFFAPVSTVALFCCLNLTFLIYNIKQSQKPTNIGLKAGEKISFSSDNLFYNQWINRHNDKSNRGFIINFITPNCRYCQEQLVVLQAVVEEFKMDHIPIINVIPDQPHVIMENFSSLKWLSDETGELRKLFKISGFPTLIVVGNNGRILEVLPGINDQFKNYLIDSMEQLKSHPI